MKRKWTILEAMEATTFMPSDLPVSIRSGLESYVTDSVNRWSELCQNFFDQERENMLLKEPTKKDLEVHRTMCRLLLLLGRAWENSILDASVPERVKLELKGRLGQLDASWSQFQNPMPAKEADLILKEVFPE